MCSDAAAKGPIKDVHGKAVEAVTRAPHPDDGCVRTQPTPPEDTEPSCPGALGPGTQDFQSLTGRLNAPSTLKQLQKVGLPPSAFPRNMGAKPLGGLRQEATRERAALSL